MRPSDILLRGKAGSTVLDTQTVTVGKVGTSYGYVYNDGTASYEGSVADGTSNLFAGNAITQFVWGATSGGALYLTIAGATNTGWTSLVVGGLTFLRANASFSGNTWTWTGVSNPFGTTVGATKTAVFS